MAGMVMQRRERVRVGGKIACHDSCDSDMAPRRVVRKRRQLKRRGRQAWKREVGR